MWPLASRLTTFHAGTAFHPFADNLDPVAHATIGKSAGSPMLDVPHRRDEGVDFTPAEGAWGERKRPARALPGAGPGPPNQGRLARREIGGSGG